jgi:hypothetical protein
MIAMTRRHENQETVGILALASLITLTGDKSIAAITNIEMLHGDPELDRHLRTELEKIRGTLKNLALRHFGRTVRSLHHHGDPEIKPLVESVYGPDLNKKHAHIHGPVLNQILTLATEKDPLLAFWQPLILEAFKNESLPSAASFAKTLRNFKPKQPAP